jgi:microcystin degradation protein MlrC
VSVFAGFPLADIHDAGLSVYVATDGDQALADRLADELTARGWDLRREFLHTALSPRDAVAARAGARRRPVVLADIADNTGGGAGGDTTEILRELLRVGARRATVACLWDPEAAARLRGGRRRRDPDARGRRQGRSRARRAADGDGRVRTLLRRPLRLQGAR